MHRHYCHAEGQEWQCDDSTCVCICDVPQNEGDHCDCPIELRECAEHAEQNGMTPKVEAGAVQIDFSVLSAERQQSVPHCECGCADIQPGASVGFCLWCDHRYAEYRRDIESRHFADHCPGAPETLKETARAGLAKRGAQT